ncbi:hypothetical protein SAMN05444166_4759 [Singulisphaera sp. GP187]|nr:hypothetical protein SAMN05444166_4759 [Singulisphaera sp. GP187]
MRRIYKNAPSPRFPTSSPVIENCIVSETVCEVRVWTDHEWQQLPLDARPYTVEYIPGLGWVGAMLKRKT